MKILLIAVLLLFAQISFAQETFKWPKGKKAAIVLTYDDGIASQLNPAIPQLNKYKLKGTFFLTGNLSEDDITLWQSVSKKGHEIANHSLYHPCSEKSYKNDPRLYVENYNVKAMINEIGMMNKILHAVDGRKPRTFAYPCSGSVVGGKDYTEALRQSGLIKYARTGGDKNSIITDFKNLNVLQVPSWGISDSPDGAGLIEFVKKAEDANGMAVLMFHGVGGNYIKVSAEAHELLLKYLAQHRKDIWVGTFQEVMDYVSTQNQL